ncbi:MAG: nuclear transport factor 2 family protein [Sneathiella sp.]
MTTTPSDPREKLSALTDKFVAAFNRQDIDDVMSFFADNAVYRDAYGKSHEGLDAIRKAFEPVLNGKLGKINFAAEDRFIDAGAGKVMDSWTLHMHMGEGAEKEASMTGLDLLYFDGGKLVTKTTYRRG